MPTTLPVQSLVAGRQYARRQAVGSWWVSGGDNLVWWLAELSLNSSGKVKALVKLSFFKETYHFHFGTQSEVHY